MKAVLRLEFIGAAVCDGLRQFERYERLVIGGRQLPPDHDEYMSRPGPRVLQYRLEGGAWAASRVFGERDYSNANSKATRGVMLRYVMDDRSIYRVKEPVSWRSMAHYFAAVSPDGGVLKMSRQEAIEWASAHLV